MFDIPHDDTMLPTWKHDLSFLFGLCGGAASVCVAADLVSLQTAFFSTTAALAVFLLLQMRESKKRQGEIQ